MPQFKPERIPEILGENLNPNFFFLNLNPSTASKANKDDFTTVIITWIELLIILSLMFIVFKKTMVLKRFK